MDSDCVASGRSTSGTTGCGCARMYRVIRIAEGDVEEFEAFVETQEEAEEIAEAGAYDYEAEHRVVDRYGEIVSRFEPEGAGA